MIHLDTNLLIYLADRDPTAIAWFGRQVKLHQEFRVSGITWYEFLSGPVGKSKIAWIESILNSKPIPFDARLAETSAGFFNKTGRARKRKIDTMIATTAILHGGKLATRNISDFEGFQSLGLALIEV